MPTVPFILPPLGLTTEQAEVVRWLRSEGEQVQEGEPVIEVETDKAVVEVEAPAAGVLQRLVVGAGERVRPGDVLAELGVDAETAAHWLSLGQPGLNPTAAPGGPTSFQGAGTARAAAPAGLVPPVQPQGPAEGSRLRASPAARRLARAHGLPLTAVQGSGPQGRIQLRDVERVIQAAGQPPHDGDLPLVAGQPLPPLRQALVQTLTASARIPQFWIEQAVDCTRLLAGLDELRERWPELPWSVNDLLIKAVACALQVQPRLNCLYRPAPAQTADKAGADLLASPAGRLQPADGVHVGLVVAVADGVVVPVLRAADRLPLPQLAERRAALVQRARTGKLARGEWTGAAVSISNLGATGPDRFQALVLPEQTAMLAVGRIRPVPVVGPDGRVTSQPQMTLTLTVDHRVADGMEAAAFLRSLVEVLVNPAPLWAT
ncbi:MAG: 2-oxo acid dehydrogenase subunit E2 [Alicyclobacillus sp.]|nr:2-oxo acid dehydrogenase subunit E2 [Alicyclobacillus sp.]